MEDLKNKKRLAMLPPYMLDKSTTSASSFTTVPDDGKPTLFDNLDLAPERVILTINGL